MYRYNAKLKKAIDGDTVELELDLGFNIFHSIRVRVAGVNCPELNEEGGGIAKAFTEAQLSHKHLYVTTHKSKAGRDKKSFDRYVADIMWIDEYGYSQSLATLLISSKFGEPK